MSVCEAYLTNILLSENGTQNLNEELMVRTFLWFKSRFCGTLDAKWLCLVLQVKHLHTLGVASLHCPAKVGKRTVLLVESVLTSCPEKLAGRNNGHLGNMMLWSDSCSCSGNRCLLHLYTSKNKLIMVNASCWVFPEHQGGLPASLPLSQFRTNSLPTKVRAHGVITLGSSPDALHFYWCLHSDTVCCL